MKYLALKERRIQRKSKRALIKYLKSKYSNKTILFGTLCPIVYTTDKTLITVLGIKIHNNKLFVLLDDWYDAQSLGIINYVDIIDIL